MRYVSDWPSHSCAVTGCNSSTFCCNIRISCRYNGTTLQFIRRRNLNDGLRGVPGTGHPQSESVFQKVQIHWEKTLLSQERKTRKSIIKPGTSFQVSLT